MDKYDVVEMVLGELAADFVFDWVPIRRGRPAVFGICRGKPVFGLPGNPVSTMVTFELFVVPAIDLLSGADARPLPTFRARLAHALNERSELTHFLPARVRSVRGEPEVSALPWQGSGDVVAMAESNSVLVVSPEKLPGGAAESAIVLPHPRPP